MAGSISVQGLFGQFDTITLAGDSSISYDGRNVEFGSDDAGKAVALTGNLQVGIATSGAPYGVLIRVESDKTCVVGKGGVHAFLIGETAPEPGDAVIAGAGGIVVAAAGGVGTGIVLGVDETAGIAWVDLDGLGTVPAAGG